jgi:hypothetical protein
MNKLFHIICNNQNQIKANLINKNNYMNNNKN